MKLLLCLVFCVGAALATSDEWSWMDNLEHREPINRRSHIRDFFGRNTAESRNNLWGNLFDDETTGSCRVSGRKVNTFRNVEVHVPSTTEYVVLSKDCSSNPSFVVLIRKLTQGADLKELKIQTRTHKLVIRPLSQSGEQLKITVNDRPVRINRDIELKENGYPVIRLIKEGSQIRVELLNKGIHVVFDGYTCRVESTQVSHDNLCGLCSQTHSQRRSRDFTNIENFNTFGQDEDTEYPEDRELDEDCTRSNKRQWWGSDRKFNDRTCQKNRRQWGFDKPEWTFDESETECEPYGSEYKRYNREFKPFATEFETEYKPFESRFNTLEKPEWNQEQSDEYESEFDQLHSGKRIVLKHKLVDNHDKVCVSLKRIPQCPVNTRPVEKIQKHVPFVCVNRNDRRVQKFEDRIHSGERIPEIERSTPTMTRTVVVPVKCTKSFY